MHQLIVIRSSCTRPSWCNLLHGTEQSRTKNVGPMGLLDQFLGPGINLRTFWMDPILSTYTMTVREFSWSHFFSLVFLPNLQTVCGTYHEFQQRVPLLQLDFRAIFFLKIRKKDGNIVLFCLKNKGDKLTTQLNNFSGRQKQPKYLNNCTFRLQRK